MPAYDASRISLLHPSWMPTVFTGANVQSAPPEAILAECARLAYFQFESSTNQEAQWAAALGLLGAVDPEWFSEPSTGTQAYAFVWPRTGQTVVAFRGTEPDSLADLGTDIDTLARAWPLRTGVRTVRVHAGFAQAFESMAARRDFAGWLARHPGDMALTGHSLGAALATLGAERWGAGHLVTIGSPRVGDADFVAALAATRIQRYVDCCDIVTTVPPELGIFAHAGAQLYIDSGGALAPGLSDADVAADRAAARVDYLEHEAWRAGTALLRDLADHAPINYLRAWF